MMTSTVGLEIGSFVEALDAVIEELRSIRDIVNDSATKPSDAMTDINHSVNPTSQDGDGARLRLLLGLVVRSLV
jgi:hypothetical protein